MSAKHNTSLYEGKGETGKKLKTYQVLVDIMKPEHYLAKPGLKNAVNVALTLGQPLLVTGEPGTGKTQLASSIAYEFSELPLFSFHVKSTSVAQDLFYQYDAIRRFQDSHVPDLSIDTRKYIDFKALGLAILLTLPPEKANKYLPKQHQGKGPTRSVILLDEIDKAPRDLPNDILIKIEKMEFSVKEIDAPPFQANKDFRPIVVITSNSEKNLPDAFLRRCIYYHIPFPQRDELKKIVKLRFQEDPTIGPKLSEELIDTVNDHFLDIRKNLNLKKKPATAELLAWFSILNSIDLETDKILKGLKQPDADIQILTEKFKSSYTVLAKTHDDLSRIEQYFEQNLQQEGNVFKIIVALNGA
ncbi:ATPase AAA [Candidatus Magnetomorum sp. HK-1]|nr:ATPase AAA [Candidatus Magnetomorum sp. HK-1]